MTRIVSDHGEQTLNQVLGASATLAERLARDGGVRVGDRIVVGLQNGSEHLQLLFACWRLGLRFIGVAPTASSGVFRHVVETLRPSAVVIDAANTRLREALGVANGNPIGWDETAAASSLLVGRNLAVPAGSDEPGERPDADGEAWTAWLERQPTAVFFTSGSTSRAKGVTLEWSRMRDKGVAVLRHYSVSAGDAVMPVLPMSHVYGLYPILGALSLGLPCVFFPESAKPATLVGAITRHRVGVVLCPPLVAAFLFGRHAVADDVRSRLHVLSIGGAATSAEVVQRLRQNLPQTRLFLSYGLVETYSTVCCVNVTAEPDKIGSVGPFRFDAIGVVRDPGSGRDLDAGEVGELCIGGGITRGYLDAEQANAEAFTEDGLFRTGDLAVVDPDGYVTLRGRLKEMINAGGLSVDPSEIEEVLLAHEAVIDCGVFGEERNGLEIVQAAVTLRDDLAAHDADAVIEALYDFCAGRLSTKMMPRRIARVERIPRGALGKIARASLRDLVAAGESVASGES
jgi:acyl-CoA synthetase (AMP-forming)/AMP-acid ligase II